MWVVDVGELVGIQPSQHAARYTVASVGPLLLAFRRRRMPSTLNGDIGCCFTPVYGMPEGEVERKRHLSAEATVGSAATGSQWLSQKHA
jgi:hypothetical protein